MGERKGQNHYYPPDFDPARHGNLNAYHGSHALRERGKKADQGILIIRFEMPFNCWCLTCNKPIGMGVRYNAEKKKVGNYYSTPIYEFSMRCAMCAGDIVIRTDPQNFEYVFVRGGRRKEQRWDPAENEQVHADDRDMKKKLALDPMYKLDHGVQDKKKIDDAKPVLSEIEALAASMKDDYVLNKLAREQFRVTKKAAKKVENDDNALLKKMSLEGSEIPLLKESEDDKRIAGLLKYSAVKSFNQRHSEKLAALEKESIFSQSVGPRLGESLRGEDTSGSSSSAGSSKLTTKEKQMLGVVKTLRQDVAPPSAFSCAPESKTKKRSLTSKDLGVVVKKGKVDSVERVESSLVGYEDSDSAVSGAEKD